MLSSYGKLYTALEGTQPTDNKEQPRKRKCTKVAQRQASAERVRGCSSHRERVELKSAGLEKFSKTRGKVLTPVRRSGEERTNILPSGELSLMSVRRIYEHMCITYAGYTVRVCVCVCLHVSAPASS